MREYTQLQRHAWASYQTCFIQQTTPEEITIACLNRIRTHSFVSDSLPQEFCQLAYDLVTHSGLYPTFDSEHIPQSTVERIRLSEQYHRLIKLSEQAEGAVEKTISTVVQILNSVILMVGQGYFSALDGLKFSVTVDQLIPCPTPIIKSLLAIGDDTLLFKQIQKAIDHNARQFIGLPFGQEWPRGKSPRTVLSQMKDAEVASLLSTTPIERFLQSKTTITLSPDVRNEHMHFVAPSGTGKTQALEHLINHDLGAVAKGKQSVFVMESERDLIPRLARHPLFDENNPNNIADRLYLIDPEIPGCMPTFSFFELTQKRLSSMNADERDEAANRIVDLYRYVFRALRGGDLTEGQGYIFNYLIRMLSWVDGANLHTLLRCLHDTDEAQRLAQNAPEKIRDFFDNVYADPKFAPRRIEVFTRLDNFASSSDMLMRMFSGKESNFDLLDAINRGSAIFVTTSKKRLGQENSQVLGRYMIALLRLLSLSRDKSDTLCFAYLDEAQEYLDEKAIELFEQGRKRKIGLVVAHQYLGQLSRETVTAIKTNTQSVFAGRLDDEDQPIMARNMDTQSTAFKALVKRDYKDTEMMFWGRGVTANGAVKVTIPFGTLDKVGLISSFPKPRWPTQNRPEVPPSTEKENSSNDLWVPVKTTE
jgi:hypothetical protein